APALARSGNGPEVVAPQLVGGHAARVTGQVLHDDRRERLVSRVAQDGHRERVDEVGVRSVDDREGAGRGRIDGVDDPYGRARGAARLQAQPLVLVGGDGYRRAQPGGVAVRRVL